MPQIFISYRRGDSAGHAGRLYDHLSAKFGEESVVIDVDSIELGLDFVKQISNFVAHCDVLLAVIGPGWINAATDDGARRIDDANDFVRLEISAALKREVRVVPILVAGAQVPKAEELPADLKGLPLRHGLNLSDERWGYDVARLVAALENDRPGSRTSAIDQEAPSLFPGDSAEPIGASLTDEQIATAADASRADAHWHCVFCGWRCDEDFNDYICKRCGQLRPYAGGSATKQLCRSCNRWSLSVARFCEWCGTRFAEP